MQRILNRKNKRRKNCENGRNTTKNVFVCGLSYCSVSLYFEMTGFGILFENEMVRSVIRNMIGNRMNCFVFVVSESSHGAPK